MLADKALVLPEGKGREKEVVTVKCDKTRVPLRPIESWKMKSPTKDTEVRVDGYRKGPIGSSRSDRLVFEAHDSLHSSEEA
jgi:hypothetical protein